MSMPELAPPDLRPGESAALAARTAARAADEGVAEIAYALVDGPVGRLVVAATPRGLLRIAYELENGGLDARARRPRGSGCRRASSRRRSASTACGASSTSTSQATATTSTWRSTGAWRARRSPAGCSRPPPKIPFGATSTYRDVAIAAGSPKAFRAAGSALGSNPIPIVVPCHRVLASSGGIGGYTGGLDRKRAAAGHRGTSQATLRATDRTRRPERPRSLPPAPEDHARHQPVRVLPARADGGLGEPICFVEQKRFKFKEDIRFYTDAIQDAGAAAHQGPPALRPARDLRRHRRPRREDRRDPEGVRREPAALDVPHPRRGRRGGRDHDREEPRRSRSSRRVVGFIPYVDNVADWLPIPYHFVFKRGERDHRREHPPDVEDPRQLPHRHDRRHASRRSIAASCWRSRSAWTRSRPASLYA